MKTLKPIKHCFGIWIDHRKAIIARPADTPEDMQEVLSHADRQPSRTDGKKLNGSFETRLVPDDDVKDRRFEHRLNAFYDSVIGIVGNSSILLIMGPGLAKQEFAKRLEVERNNPPEIHLVSAGQLTNPQILDKIRTHFKPLPV
jgi:hypothetical protein